MLGNYINPDDIERAINDTGYVDFTSYRIESHKAGIFEFFREHALSKKSPRSLAKLDSLAIEGERLSFANTEIDSYVASALSDFIRRSLIKERISFTFETVMSSSDKVNLLAEAHDSGYRVYVYYVATADPEINIARVAYRVSQGGHSVPPEKIKARYWRSLELLSETILTSNRAYIFDNSDEGSEGLTQIAEITDGELIEIKSAIQPP
ncbi:zeta toxin family protein [Pseudomonas sp. NPDC087614]|uniref:zeta toxin family protein n=1 Tax=Pseudomonas sp. NPDC087614 TaxID=3364442 RepID=UPI00381DC319